MAAAVHSGQLEVMRYLAFTQARYVIAEPLAVGTASTTVGGLKGRGMVYVVPELLDFSTQVYL